MKLWAALTLAIAVPCSAQDVSGASEQALVLEQLQRALIVESSDPCLSTPPLGPEVVRWLHGAQIDPELTVRVRAVPIEGTLQIEIAWRGEAVGERSFEGRDATCNERRAALGLVIALAIETAQTERNEPEPPARPDVRGGLTLDALGAMALLPEVAGGAALGLEIEGAWWSLRAAAFGALTTDVALGPGTISTALVAGLVHACLGEGPSPWRFEGCLGAGVGGLNARGHGYTRDQSAWILWAAASATVNARWELDRTWALGLGVGVLVPFVRPEIVISGPWDEVVSRAELSPVAGLLSIGVRAILF